MTNHKTAYPNISGKLDRDPIYEVDKWIDTIKQIYATIHSDELTRVEAIKYFTDKWDDDERRSFINWMKYYESGTTEKYNVKTADFLKQAFGTDIHIPGSWVNREDRAQDGVNLSTQKKNETKREKELEKARQFKTKMKARLRSFKSLLDKYNDVLPKQDLDGIYEELHRLEKGVSKLDVYASIRDCVIRSANRINKFGFSEGADFLYKCADETSVINSLPEGSSNLPDVPVQSQQMQGLTNVINRLEGMSKELKSRDLIRELASIDILLNEMGLASFFPELSFAQSKLIEAFGYASNKVEDIVAKLRGSGNLKPIQQAPQPKQMPIQTQPPKQPIDTKDIMDKPVSEVKEKLPTG